MPEVAEPIYIPELQGGSWIQGGPLSLKELRGKTVVLIDFWDYTCVNCIRTLPYVIEWDRKYRDLGLVTVGVHAPEFSFAANETSVRSALADFGITYPIVLDNDYAIWRAFSNRYWPAKYLAGASGRLRYFHFGEGAYDETEQAIQKLLTELNPKVKLPELAEPVRDSDRPGAVCYRVTPELYVGHARGKFGNPGGVVVDKAHQYSDPGHHGEGLVYLEGQWSVSSEFASAQAPEASIAIRYTAKEVNLVMQPPATGPVKMTLVVDRGQKPGVDVECNDDGTLAVSVNRARMYNLVANDSVMSAGLKLTVQRSGAAVYAFTFVSCAVA